MRRGPGNSGVDLTPGVDVLELWIMEVSSGNFGLVGTQVTHRKQGTVHTCGAMVFVTGCPGQWHAQSSARQSGTV
jgi:hypothetical protein